MPVGNFGGPKALRAVGKANQDHGATAFCLSTSSSICIRTTLGRVLLNVASVPRRCQSSFARRRAGRRPWGLMTYLGEMQNETNCRTGDPRRHRDQPFAVMTRACASRPFLPPRLRPRKHRLPAARG